MIGGENERAGDAVEGDDVIGEDPNIGNNAAAQGRQILYEDYT